ncbi:hypothetical protein GCM10010885_19830 [Alicyclobacillus cellulosilyticus]|uniref:Spore germination protein GerPA/GerPF n=1 Tax=Alicyclobacillus cellulosilyticus TaxID=1003997 RepID=A0A917KFU9_9BACL|nr:hypothetical protein [Alicyclobacillus cellulosilyticus]GGJ10650.1 hypothetical protein GCM10010885_19830 [Alicyclobacillus cellulosilyticus]
MNEDVQAVRSATLPVSIQVQNMQSCSGVLVGGQNIVYGWSAHSKSNAGFGTLESSNLVYKLLTLVSDPDTLDTPIDDRDVHVFTKVYRSPPVTHIGLHALNVNMMQQNAGVFVGDADINGWDQHQKTNKGHGDTYGHHNGQVRNVQVNFDPDVVDTPVADQDMKAGVFQRIG